jgi:DNA end-binding protein Ku
MRHPWRGPHPAQRSGSACEYDDLEIPDSAEVTRREIEMAVKLVEQQEGKFTPSKFKDTYIAALKKLINAKAKEKKVEPTKSSDLIEQLKASLERSGASA